MKLNFTKTITVLALAAGLLISCGTKAQTGIITAVDSFPVLLGPLSLAIDAAGNIYIADQWNLIHKVAAGTGVVTTVAGNGYGGGQQSGGYTGDGGPADSAEFFFPHGVAVDDSGNIYISDTYNQRVRKVTAATGIITTIAGSGPGGLSSGGYSGDGHPGTSAQLNWPQGVAVDHSGNVYISDLNNFCIRVVNGATGIITTYAGNGVPGYSGDNEQAIYAEFDNNEGLALDNMGNLYIADGANRVIRKITAATGIITTVAGNGTEGNTGDGGQATEAELDFPSGVAVDNAGNIYIADEQGHQIRKVNIATGIISTVAGGGTNGWGFGGPADSAYLAAPYDVAVDASNNLYIVDANSNYLSKVSYALIVHAGANQTVCTGSNIILNPIVSGGIPPYQYSWHSNGSALSCTACQNPSVSLTQNSTFTLTVTDARQNTATSSVSYTVNGSQNSVQFSVTNSNTHCSNLQDTTTVNITGGTGPFKFDWGNGDTSSGASAQTFYYATPGQYLIAVTDVNGCQTATLDTVLNLGVIATVLQAIQPGCPGHDSGEIIVSLSGGYPPYNLLWNDSTTSDTLLNAAAGYYSLSVTDASLCVAQFNYALSPAYTLSNYYVFLTPTMPNCGTPGSISSITTGGAQPYHYAWNNSDTGAAIYSLNPGNYAVTVTDSSGCTTTGHINLPNDCVTIISGSVFVDTNNNCILDPGERTAYDACVIANSSNSGIFFSTTNQEGKYSLLISDTGTFSLFVNAHGSNCDNFIFCGNPGQIIHAPTLGDNFLNNNIVFDSSSGFDLTIHPGWSSAYPGSQKEYWVMPYNSSLALFTGQATVIFTYDSNLIYQYSLPPLPVVDTVTHTLTWVVDSVPSPYYDWDGRFRNFFMVPSTLSLNYELQSRFQILPDTGDCAPYNNYFSIPDSVNGSFDPNEKDVLPAGSLTSADSVLTYTIHFQNTGTDSTHFIIVIDTLSQNLDPSSVQNIASSYKYSDFNISGKGILTWTFNPYRLVDSTTNPAGSKGFITFTVNERKDLPMGATINNTASIYFDYNTPVVTNTVTDTVGHVTGISEAVGEPGISVSAFPNPFNDQTTIAVSGLNQKFDFELFDLTGRLQRSIPSITTRQFEMPRNDLAGGVYLYRILVSGKQAAYGKLVVE